MAELAGNDSEVARSVIDELIRSATLELFRTEAPALTPARVRRGSLPEATERFGLGARVRFSGAGGSGFLALGCSAHFSAGAGAEMANLAWVAERVEALGHRIEKRLRQFGVAVRLETPEPLSVFEPELGSATPPFRTTHLFGAGNAELFVHLDGQLDIERIASAGEVPLRDEGDIIFF